MSEYEIGCVETAVNNTSFFINPAQRPKAAYGCCGCGKAFKVKEFGALPVIDSKLYCDECYAREIKKPGWQTGGRLIRLIHDGRVDAYAFSHSAASRLTFVAYNERDGYLTIKQEMTDCGCGFRIDGMDQWFHGIFHPFLYYFQTNNCVFPSDE